MDREQGAGYRYTPTAGYTGSDSFDYQLTDEFGAQGATVRVSLTRWTHVRWPVPVTSRATFLWRREAGGAKTPFSGLEGSP